MTASECIVPLTSYLAKVVDPRKAKGIRYPLVAILCLCSVALLAGAQTPNAIVRWWQNQQDGRILERLGFTRGQGPSKSTLYRILSWVSPNQLVGAIQCWAEANLANRPLEPGEKEGIALDGKTLRGSRKQGAKPSHLLAAVSHRLGLLLGQVAVDDKTNEIGLAPELLVDLIIKGRVLTMDALLTQRELAQAIVEGQGDYVMMVKENQSTLRDDIAVLFSEDAPEFIDGQVTCTDKGHGRLETRRLQTSSTLKDFLDWPGQQQVFRLERQTVLFSTGQTRGETGYGITSLSPQEAGAESLLALVQGQWTIENKNHWVRDVTLGEDRSQVRKGFLPQVLATLRSMVIGLARLMNFRFLPEAISFFAAHPFDALAAVGC